jgi:hypothetical protein
MAIRITDAGGQAILNSFFKTTGDPTSFSIQLFIAATQPTLADSDAYNTFTVCTTGGAEAKSLTIAGATVSNPGIPQVAWAEQTWTFTTTQANPIQGYQIITNTNVVVCEELLGSAVTAGTSVTLKITPTIQLGNGSPT